MTVQEDDWGTVNGMPETVQAHTIPDDNTYGFDTGGIVSYVVPPRDSELNIVDAVNVVPEHKILEESTKKKRLNMLAGIILLAIIILVVIVLVVRLLTRRETIDTGFVPDINNENTEATVARTQAPSFSPTIAAATAQAIFEFSMVLETYYEGSESIFSNTLTPQYRAAVWAAESAIVEGIDMNDDRMIQRYALATFYFSTNGDDWVNCGRQSKRCDETQEWLTGADECSWYAIECDAEGHATEIYFPPNGESSNNIRGPLPYELSFLSKLSAFIIARGPLSGPFPDWSKLTTLQQVLLNENEFEGTFPTYLLSENPLLGTIQFNSNNFEGLFLQDLLSADPIAVEDISVNGNNFTGTVSSQLGNLASLRHLDIGSNEFLGTLPEELYSLTNLLHLKVSGTSIKGDISSSIGTLSKLMEFQAGNTDMSGSLPTSFFSLTQLRTLDLRNAKFTGSLSESFSNLTNLDVALLSDNAFIGTIPPGLENLPFLEHLELHGNNLSGSVPQELCNHRGEGFMQLQVLTVDCSGDDPEVSCTCCTNCPT